MNIFQAAKTGNLSRLNILVSQGEDVNQIDLESGWTPLIYAAKSTKAGVEILQTLIQAGADVNATDTPPTPPKTPEGLPEELNQKFEEMKSNLARYSSKERPVLYFAVQADNLEKLKCLVEAGADIHYKRIHGYDILIDALYGGNNHDRYPIIKYLIDQGVSVAGMSDYHESAISVASRMSYFHIVKLLMDADADITQLEWEPLMFAAVFGELSELERILAKGYDSGEQERFGRTAFHLAIQTGEIERVRLFLNYGANIEERGLHGYTPLIYAAKLSDPSILALLLEKGAYVDAGTDFGNTALMQACLYNRIPHIKLLIEADANLNLINSNGETAIDQASDPAAVYLLMEHDGEWGDMNFELRQKLLGLPEEFELSISEKEYKKNRSPRFGTSNPEVMDNPFWCEMVKGGFTAYHPRKKFNDILIDKGPTWCFDRFGKSMTLLPDGRVIEIGGEHEDFYDPDFYIYNDVFVFDGKGNFTIYGYPKYTFPPTDFHTATLVNDYIYIIGGLGYKGERKVNTTPVYRLNINTLKIELVKTSGERPGWIFKHKASLEGGNKILISEGEIQHRDKFVSNEGSYSLDLTTMQWQRIDERK